MEENNKDMVQGSAENEPKVETPNVEEPKKEVEKTFTRDEVNKMINAEKQKERNAVLAEVANQKAEAEKLAKMDEDQKKDYQLQEALRRAEEAEKKLGARDLESETLKQANNKGIPLELISTIDFEKETAETIAKKLEVFERTSKSVREKAINEYSGEEAPKVGDKVNTTPKSGYEKFLENNK